jgi:hypothetical protein
MRVLFVLGLVTAFGVWAQEVTGDWRARLVEVAMEQTKEVVRHENFLLYRVDGRAFERWRLCG